MRHRRLSYSSTSYRRRSRISWSSACTGSSGCIHDQGIHIDHTFFDDRVSGQDRAGGITAGISHQSGFLLMSWLICIVLVYRFLYKLRRLVLDAVPFFIDGNILDAVISGIVLNFHLAKDSSETVLPGIPGGFGTVRMNKTQLNQVKQT